MKRQNTKKAKRVQLLGVDGQKRNLKFPPTTSATDFRDFKLRARRMVKTIKAGWALSDADLTYATTAGANVRQKLCLLGVLGDSDAQDEKYLLGPFLSRYLELDDGPSAPKKQTVALKIQNYFGPDKDLRTITALEAQEFRKALANRWNLSETSTIPRHIGYCCSMFSMAVEDGLIARNPFAKQNKVVQPNRARWHHISKAETQAIWQNLESEADKLRFILLRYLGLRAPSEMNLLTWECFCWETHTVLIRSPKTKGNADGGFRRCPFGHPDILPTLKKAFDARESDTSSVVPPIKHAPLTRKVQKWLGRAGLPIWPMLLQNFRRSAASDARTVLPAHIASAAFGHTEGVFNKHYAVHTQEQLNSFGKMSSLLS